MDKRDACLLNHGILCDDIFQNCSECEYVKALEETDDDEDCAVGF